jgi:hypothetical protein
LIDDIVGILSRRDRKDYQMAAVADVRADGQCLRVNRA